MRDWIIDKVLQNVNKIESFYRVRQLPGSLMLSYSEGAYAAVYEQYGLGESFTLANGSTHSSKTMT